MSKKRNDPSKLQREFHTRIGEYVSHRRSHPGFERGLDTIHDFDQRLKGIISDCTNFGLDQELIFGACGSYQDFEVGGCRVDDYIDELSLRLLEEIIRQEDMQREGTTHLVRRHEQIPNSIIAELTLMMVESCLDHFVTPPQALAVLLRAQLGRFERRTFLPRKSEEKNLAALLVASDPEISARKIAETIGVNHTTVDRWLREKDFRDRVEAAPKIAPVDGLIRVLRATRDQK